MRFGDFVGSAANINRENNRRDENKLQYFSGSINPNSRNSAAN